MSDEDSMERPDAGALSAMYLETLRLRMESDKFGALADALKGMKKASEAGFDGTGYEVNEELFTDEVRREFATVLAMAATGRTDDRVVEVVEGDPSVGWAVVTAEVADDPVKLAEVREQLLRMVDEGELPE
ncbi:hypothetical protein [Actinacidiphila sp. ITFR-21]|uniref:hypothetical protein n=1 Tax=Actinacidiphila sp. ITFR-21 TaxID=3075199 RepID=UPI00288B5785|nr:hypothetical protein [Streptomyces sp. ITFR-21]WNI20222.1 hypothetical protein RLT57_32270 [Streptomyces sp. ITFR-21]